MIEKLVYMQVEDKKVTFEKEDGSTIIYPLFKVPKNFKLGDIIKVIIFEEDVIAFIGIDKEEMNRRRANIKAKKMSLRERAKRATNES